MKARHRVVGVGKKGLVKIDEYTPVGHVRKQVGIIAACACAVSAVMVGLSSLIPLAVLDCK